MIAYRYVGRCAALENQSIWVAHSFTRNRTRGSDYSQFSSLAWEVPTIIARCFRVHFWQRAGSALRGRTGTISREAAVFFC
jgi:hypothetical protein